MKNSTKGYALVTGASSGIGAAMAAQLAEREIPLILVARRAERLEALKKEIQQKHEVAVEVLPRDLAQKDAAKSLFLEVQQQGWAVEYLINNAGVGIQGKFLEMSQERIDLMNQLNISTLTELTRLFGQQMVSKKSGYILQVASAVAFIPSPFVSAYAGSKAYVLGFSEAIWYELLGTGVSVTTLYPGITPTEFNQVAGAKTPKSLNLSIVSTEKVAAIGLKAMFRRKRAVIPGLINKLNAWFSRTLPRGLVIRMAGAMMKKANQ